MKYEQAKAGRYRWYMFWIFAIQYLLLFFHRVCPAVLAPDLMQTFKISGAALGVLSSGYFYTYALMQIPIGIISDSWGPRKTATLFGAIAAAGSILFALSPFFSFAVFARILIGLGVSAVFVPAMKVYADWFHGREFARITGIFIAIGGLGWLAGATPLAALSQIMEWRWIFVFVGVLTVILTVFTWLCVVDTPHKQGSFATGASRPVRAEKKKLSADIKMIFSDRHFWPLAMWFFFRTGILFGFFGLWAGPYLMDVYRLSKVSLGNILCTIPVAMVVGSPFLGYLSDKVFVSRKKVIMGTSVIHALCWLVMFIFYDKLPVPILYAVFFIVGVVAGAPGSVGFAAAKELFPTNIAGTSIGAVNFFAFVGGIFLQPWIGHVLDKAGKINGAYPPEAYRTAILVLFLISLASVLSALLSRETFSLKGKSAA